MSNMNKKVVVRVYFIIGKKWKVIYVIFCQWNQFILFLSWFLKNVSLHIAEAGALGIMFLKVFCIVYILIFYPLFLNQL